MGVQGTAIQLDGYWSKDCIGQKTFSTGRGPYLRGLADDITRHHYGVCDICRNFGDAFYIKAPATVARVREWRCWPMHNDRVTDGRN